MPKLLNIRLHKLFIAIRADAMTESDFRMLDDILFHLTPVILVIADFLAVGADRQESLESSDL